MKKAIIVTNYFYPAFKAGGPIRSVKNLVDFAKETLSINVLTSNFDLDLTHLDVETDHWIDNDGYQVMYCSSAKRLISIYFSLRKYDIVYLNSFFSFFYSILPILFCKTFCKKTIVIAPRGELTKGAMSIKNFKKSLYLRFFKILGLKSNLIFHFTSQEEVNESLLFLPGVKYIVAPNMHESIPPFKVKKKDKGDLNLTFLSRISVKKNLKVIFESLLHVKHSNVNFNVVGPIDDPVYWSECLEISNSLPSNIKFKYCGAADRTAVKNILSDSHCFILPTLNENYGHAIVEAMIYGNIILISNKTPWSSVSENGGHVLNENDVIGYSSAIIEIANLDERTFNERSHKSYMFCKIHLNENEKKVMQVFDREVK